MSAEDALAILDSHRPEWWNRAACRGVGPDIFFAEVDEYSEEEVEVMHAQAKNFCKSCEVRRECEEQRRKEKHGIWNGKHATE